MVLIKCTEEQILQHRWNTNNGIWDGGKKLVGGGGGNCVVIKHNSTYQTVYAHMSKFASGIRSGVRVKQGQTIGL